MAAASGYKTGGGLRMKTRQPEVEDFLSHTQTIQRQ